MIISLSDKDKNKHLTSAKVIKIVLDDNTQLLLKNPQGKKMTQMDVAKALKTMMVRTGDHHFLEFFQRVAPATYEVVWGS